MNRGVEAFKKMECMNCKTPIAMTGEEGVYECPNCKSEFEEAPEGNETKLVCVA